MFPRFYFIGDDGLLEILGQSTNPQVIQTHLKKLFAGIHSVEFDDGCQHIMAMKSLDGEVVPLRNKVQIVPEVEVSFILMFYQCFSKTTGRHGKSKEVTVFGRYFDGVRIQMLEKWKGQEIQGNRYQHDSRQSLPT